MVAAGFTGVDDVFSGERNFFQAYGAQPDPGKLADGLGERFEILGTNIKKWSAGSPAQSAIDALLHLMETAGVTARNIKSITVHLPTGSDRTVDRTPAPDVNVQHLLAMLLIDGTLTFRSIHDHARMADPKILALRAKMQVVPSDELLHARPRRQAIVEVETNDGARHIASHRRGPRHRRQPDERPRGRGQGARSHGRGAGQEADRGADRGAPRPRHRQGHGAPAPALAGGDAATAREPSVDAAPVQRRGRQPAADARLHGGDGGRLPGHRRPPRRQCGALRDPHPHGARRRALFAHEHERRGAGAGRRRGAHQFRHFDLAGIAGRPSSASRFRPRRTQRYVGLVLLFSTTTGEPLGDLSGRRGAAHAHRRDLGPGGEIPGPPGCPHGGAARHRLAGRQPGDGDLRGAPDRADRLLQPARGEPPRLCGRDERGSSASRSPPRPRRARRCGAPTWCCARPTACSRCCRSTGSSPACM